jgi:histidinol-phosphatase
MTIPDAKVLDAVRDTAVAAVEATSDLVVARWEAHRGGGLTVMAHEVKSDRSPVTAVDEEVEARIREIVRHRFPEHRILGEERGAEGALGSPFLWVIDPIDGTKPFVRGLPHFGTLVAVMYKGQVVVGVSHAPALRETAVAVRGQGAFLDGQRLAVSDIQDLAGALVIHGGVRYFLRAGKLDRLGALSERIWGTDGFKDFWSYHLLASGRVDAVLEADTNVWDIAAASLIVEEAGGRATDFAGERVGPQTTSMIASNGLIHEELLSALAGAEGPETG